MLITAVDFFFYWSFRFFSLKSVVLTPATTIIDVKSYVYPMVFFLSYSIDGLFGVFLNCLDPFTS